MKHVLSLALSLILFTFLAAHAQTFRPEQTPCEGTVERHVIYSPQLGMNVAVDVWLPKDYDVQTGRTYPVIYMQDGQGSFDARGSFAGEWQIDETLSRMHKDGMCETAVVVGIHSTTNRFGDYSPEKALEPYPGLKERMSMAWNGQVVKGDAYLDFVVNTIMPQMEAKYRIRRDPRSVSLLGSSMGGLISLYAMCEYPDRFGNAACLSTHWIGALDLSTSPDFPQAVMEYLKTHLPTDGQHRLYLDHGTEGLDAYYPVWHKKAVEIALSKGYKEGYTLMSVTDEGATHNEACWARRLPVPLEFVLGPMLPPLDADAWKFGLPYRLYDGLILHCFEWKLNDIIAELPRIAAAGFKSVQISPMQRAVKCGDTWYDVYRPSDYHFEDNGMGTRDDLRALCAEAARYGIKIVVDIVANHGTGPDEDHDPWWDINGRMKYGKTIDYSSRYSETHDCLGGYGESNSDDPDVQQRTRDYILELKDMGVAGLRWDAAKHIGLPSEGCDFWPAVLSVPGIWSYGEILGTPAEDPSKLKEYADMMWVTNTNGADHTWTGLEYLGIPSGRLLHWVESHDTFCANYTQDIAQPEVERRWALIAARADATALYLSRPVFGSNTAMKVGAKGGMEFANKAVAAANHFHNAMVGQPEHFLETSELRAVYRHRGVVIVKDGGGSVSIPIYNLDPDINYADEITGAKFTVADGNISGVIDPSGIAVVYDQAGSISATPLVAMDPLVESFEGESCRITLHAINAATAAYSVDGADPVEFRDVVNFEIGKGAEAGTQISIRWIATSPTGETAEGEMKVLKIATEPVRVYLHFDEDAYDNLQWYTYIYTPTGTMNAIWPGQPMLKDESISINGYSTNWRVYEVPADLSFNGMAMVSSSKTDVRYPANGVPGIPINSRSIVFLHHGGHWSAVPLSDMPSGVESVVDDALPFAMPLPGGITVNFPGVAVYSVSGQAITVTSEPCELHLPPGVYVLRHGAAAMKIIVK